MIRGIEAATVDQVVKDRLAVLADLLTISGHMNCHGK
jgi:hypothetical protein